MYEVAEVRGDDTVAARLYKALQQCLSYGAANLGLCARAELVDQQQRLRAGIVYKKAHVAQVRRVGRQVVFDTLVVAYVNHYIFEEAEVRVFIHRWQHAALQHILHHSHCFECHRLAAGIRTRYEQNPFFRRQTDIERYNLLARALQSGLEYRMPGVVPFKLRLGMQLRHCGVDLFGI